MALLQDRVQETTTTAGTGTFTLNGAVVGYVTFNSVFTNGNIVWYVADDGAGNWEIGTGTLGTGTLTRTVFQSSNANALVPFAAGTKRLFCSAPYTYLLPDQTGNNGLILTTNGTTPSWTSSIPSGITFTDVVASGGLYAKGSLAATFTDGIVVDYATGNGRISVGPADSLTFYTGGVANTAMASMTSTGINSTAIGATTASTGAFTTLSASSTVSGTGFSTYLASPPPIGSTTANTGAFTTLSASSTVSGTGFSNWLTSQLTTPPPIGGTTPSTGAFTSLTSTLDTIATDGLWAKGALNATFTDGTVVDFVTGNGRISVGTNDNLTFYTGGVATTQVFQVKYTGQINIKPLAAAPTGAAGDIYYNSVSNQFQGYNGTAWLPVGGASISNDTTTATPLYPVFANATSGTATTVYTSNANYLYTPSTGELKAPAPTAGNGIFLNANTINTSYTIAASNNGGSFGPVSVASGVTVTVSSGSTWTVV